jgi:hypothetical protein
MGKSIYPKSNSTRRTFMKYLGASALAAASPFAFEEEIAYGARNVNRNSSPSNLKITDMRFAVIKDAPMRCPIIRIDTNQGICGWGEPYTGPKSLQCRKTLQTHQTVRASWPTGRGRIRNRDGVMGSGRKSL